MIIGLGTDIVRIDRIARLHRRFGKRFITRILTESEQQHLARFAQGTPRYHRFLATRFAAKEATAKALGTGIGARAGLREIEVIRSEGTPPALRLHGAAAHTAQSKATGDYRLHLSLSDDAPFALATVVLEAL